MFAHFCLSLNRFLICLKYFRSELTKNTSMLKVIYRFRNNNFTSELVANVLERFMSVFHLFAVSCVLFLTFHRRVLSALTPTSHRRAQILRHVTTTMISFCTTENLYLGQIVMGRSQHWVGNKTIGDYQQFIRNNKCQAPDYGQSHLSDGQAKWSGYPLVF